jgi:hypothetical protein
MKKIIHHVLCASTLLFLLGACPPNTIIVKLKNDAETTIAKQNLLLLATKSETLKNILEEIEEQGQIQEINLPTIDASAFAFLNSIAIPEILPDEKRFSQALAQAKDQMGEKFETILDMLNYFDIALPKSFQEMFKKVISKRRELEKEEKKGKRVKKEVESQLFSITIPKEEKTTVAIIKSSQLLKDLIKDVHGVSPEELPAGTQVTIGNITEEDWKELTTLAGKINIENEEQLEAELIKRNFGIEELKKLLKIADYLDMSVLKKSAEKTIAPKLVQLLGSGEYQPIEFLQKLEDLPKTSHKSIAQIIFSSNDVLNAYGWLANEVNTSKIYQSDGRILYIGFNQNRAFAIFFGASVQIIWLSPTAFEQVSFNLSLKSFALNRQNSICVMLTTEALWVYNLDTRKPVVKIPVEQLEIPASLFDMSAFAFAFSEDSHLIFMRTSDKIIKVIDIQDPKNIQIKKIVGSFGFFGTIAYDSLKKIIAVSKENDSNIQLIDLSDEKKNRILATPALVGRIWFDAESNLIVKSEKNLYIWDIQNNIQLSKFTAGGEILNFDPFTGDVVFQDENKSIRVVNSRTTEVITSFKSPEKLTMAAMNSSNTSFIGSIKNRIILASNRILPMMQNLSLTQIFIVLIIFKLAGPKRGTEFSLSQDMMNYFQELPEELQKDIKAKLKIK